MDAFGIGLSPKLEKGAVRISLEFTKTIRIDNLHLYATFNKHENNDLCVTGASED